MNRVKEIFITDFLRHSLGLSEWPLPREEKVEIVHIAAELAPVAKVGGLGDVVHGLSKASIEKNAKVEVILPKYNTLHFEGIKELKPMIGDLLFDFDGKKVRAKVWKGVVDGIDVALIESKEYFERNAVYGLPDDPVRFAFFSKAALEYLCQGKRDPTILHIHDWHASLVAPLLQEKYATRGLHSQVVLTIHNLYYQGKTDGSLLRKISLTKTEDLTDPQNSSDVNLLRAGIAYSDFVTTVSPTYGKEILHGDPLSSLLAKKGALFKGILNGIDYGYWNPTNDHFLPIHFSVEQIEKKRELKKILRERLSLEEEDSPIVSAIARLTPQKGPHLIKHALYRTLERGGQFVFLGSAPEGDTHEVFFNLKKKLSGSKHVHLELTYNEKLSHLVFAASDLFLVPSLFEPCGLTQLISMRYGTIPLVRQTGGLADTVFEGKNGYTFKDATSDAICESIDRALWCWFHEKEKWKKLAENGMRTDHSWKGPVEEYFEIYTKLKKVLEAKNLLRA